MTVRQVFYQATVRGVVEKTEARLPKVQRDLVQLRQARHLPFAGSPTLTRWMRKPRTFGSIEAALARPRTLPSRLWGESRHSRGLAREGRAGRRPRRRHRGIRRAADGGARIASLSFLHAAAEAIAASRRAGLHLPPRRLRPVRAQRRREHRGNAARASHRTRIHFERLAVHRRQIAAWRLPTRPTKTSRQPGDGLRRRLSVELDAIEPQLLRDLVRTRSSDTCPAYEFERLAAGGGRRAGAAPRPGRPGGQVIRRARQFAFEVPVAWRPPGAM